jgi:hypothetical protein
MEDAIVSPGLVDGSAPPSHAELAIIAEEQRELFRELAKAHRTIHALRRENADLQADLAAARSTSTTRSDNVDALRAALANSDAENEKLKGELAAFKAHYRELQTVHRGATVPAMPQAVIDALAPPLSARGAPHDPPMLSSRGPPRDPSALEQGASTRFALSRAPVAGAAAAAAGGGTQNMVLVTPRGAPPTPGTARGAAARYYDVRDDPMGSASVSTANFVRDADDGFVHVTPTMPPGGFGGLSSAAATPRTVAGKPRLVVNSGAAPSPASRGV